MDLPISTNIVPIENPSEEVKVEDKPEFNKNLEKDLVQFLQEEFKENNNGEFWKYVRDFACVRLGEPIAAVKVSPMTDEQIKNFSKQEVPWGRFAGQKVSTVEKKDREFLERMCIQPLLFQKQLRRFLASTKKG